MLTNIRESLTGWKALVAVAVISLPFAFFGVNDYFFSDGATYVAKVGDVEISERAFTEQWQNYRRQMQQNMGASFDPSTFDTTINRRRVLDQMVDAEVLRQVGREHGVLVTSEALRNEIESIEAFQTDGKFDPDKYQMLLRAQGMNIPVFESRLGQDLQVQALRQPLLESGFATGTEFNSLMNLQEQRRSISYIALPPESQDAVLDSITDAGMKTYYDAHTSEFVSPYQVEVEYIELDQSLVKLDTVVSDDVLKERYEETKAQFGTPETRKAAHILIEMDDANAEAQKAALSQANEIQTKASADKADFAALAKEFSKDLGSKNTGGELGWIQQGSLEKPFEEALFAMKAGEVSKPIQTSQGWHIIKLLEVKEGNQKPFEAVRAELEKDYLASDRERRFNEIGGEIVDEIYRDPSTLTQAAKIADLTVKKAGPFDRNSVPAALREPKLIRFMFDETNAKLAEASDPYETAAGKQVVARVIEAKPESTIPFAEAKSKVKDAMIRQQQKQLMADKLGAGLSKVNAGTSMDDLAESWAQKVVTPENPIGRQGSALPPTVVEDVFLMTHPSKDQTVYGDVVMDNGQGYLIALKAVEQGKPDAMPAEMQGMFKQQFGQMLANIETRAVLDIMKEAMDVEVNADRIEQNNEPL